METLASVHRRHADHPGPRAHRRDPVRAQRPVPVHDPAAPGRGADPARLRLPHPGRGAVRVGRFTAIVAAVDLRGPAGHPARRCRHPVRLADGPRGRAIGRVDGTAAALEGPAAAVPAGAAPRSEPGHRAWSSRWSSSAASSAPARSGFDVISGFAQREDFGKGLAAGVAIVLLGIMLDRITQGAGGRRIDGRGPRGDSIGAAAVVA